jgi:hypothetical protein
LVVPAGRARRSWRVWSLESLEDRVLLAGNPTIYTVNSTGSGSSGTGTSGTLPYVITQADANTNVAGSLIEFDPTLFSTPQTITLTNALTLSESTGPEVIDGLGPSLVTISGGGTVGVFTVASGTSATLRAITVSGGATGASGGGIVNNGTLAVVNSAVAGCSAVTSGGGIFNTATLTITGSTISGNAVSAKSGSGGGIENAGTLSIVNTTIAGNEATGQVGFGGGLDNAGTLTAVSVTIARNTVAPAGYGGGISLTKGLITLDNTIVALNTAGAGSGASASDITSGALGVLVSPSSANNLIGTGGSGGLAAGLSGNQVGVVVPGLASTLADNGGPTQTLALMPGSPAIDGGSTSIPGVSVPQTDQRGALRGPDGLHAGPTVDIGAYEASSSYLVTSTDDTVGAGTLRAGVGWANVNTNANPANLKSPSPNIVVFDTTGAFATPQTITLNPSLGTLALSNSGMAEAVEGPGPEVVTVSGANATGVFEVAAGVTAILSSLTVADGSSASSGGGISSAGNLTVSSVTFTGDSAADVGGAIANAGTMTVADSSIFTSSATSGGGIVNDAGTMFVTGTTIADNSATNGGGGIANENGSVTVTGSTIADNSATNGGGIANNGTMTVTSTTLDHNSAGDGAGVNNLKTLTMTNATIADNTASAGAGGGIESSGTLTLINVTVADNAVPGSTAGGGLDATAGTAALYNTIVALNTTGNGNTATASDIGAGTGIVSSSSANNLIGTGGAGGLTGGSHGNQVDVVNVELGALAENGGTTQTVALLAGSPAIDGGSAAIPGVTIPATDERGALRGPAGLDAGSAVDIGSYEASSSFLVTTAADSIDPGTLRTGIGWANVSTNANPANLSNPVPNTIVFDTSGAFATVQTISLFSGLGTLGLTNTATSEAIAGPGASIVTISGSSAIEVLSVASGVVATVSGVTITGGSTSTSGGGLSNAGSLTIIASAIAGNSATEFGGGIHNTGVMSIVNCVIANNSALVSDGGGIDNEGTMAIAGSTITGNAARDTNATVRASGGAIANFGTMAITSSTVANNSVQGGDGGGIENQAGTMTIAGSTIANNLADAGLGGGMDVFGTATVSNSTIAGNSAGAGGGISVERGGALLSVSTTIVDNFASASAAYGGGLDADGGTAALYDTIVAENSGGSTQAASDVSLSGSGAVSASSAYNLIGIGGSGGLTQGLGGNLVGVADPALGPLASNGGATPTIAVLPGSAAIGAGMATLPGVAIPATDQRGVARPSSKIDIGAFQDRGFTMAVVTGATPQSAPFGTAFANALAVTVTSPSGDPVQGGIVSFTESPAGSFATLSAPTATIGAGGLAEVTAAATGAAGQTTVTATAAGSLAPVSFALTTTVAQAGVGGFDVAWGSRTAALRIPASAGGLLLPAGRQTDLPWVGITRLSITLTQPEALVPADVTIRSRRTARIRSFSLVGSGTFYIIALSRPVTAADRLTITIAVPGMGTFISQLNVLPGDFNDDGVVNRADLAGIHNEARGLAPATIFGDLNGDGAVDARDANVVRRYNGQRLPRLGRS